MRQASSPRSLGNALNSFLTVTGAINHIATNQQEKETEAAFVHPIIIPADYKKSLDLYRQHIKKYNIQVWLENKAVRDYNKEVIRFRKKASIDTEQKIREAVWKENHKDLNPERYNEAVEAYNEEHGPQLRKKNLRQEVKPESEKYFLAFLHQYSQQLYKRKTIRQSLEVHVPGELPKLELYPNKISTAEINGCKTLPVSKEAIRHHRERLEEAGVLNGYEYRGSTRALKVAFNPAVLSITDNGNTKKAAAENQSVTGMKTNKVRHNNVSSIKNLLEKNKYREEGVVATAPTDQDCTKESTKKPKRQGGDLGGPNKTQSGEYQKKFTGPRNSTGSSQAKNQISTALAANIDERTILARGLAAGKADQYQPVSPKIAQQEAFYGALHPDDFKELAIQDVFKFSASIFKDLQVHPGSWMKAYKIWMKEKFTSFTGQTLSKPNILEHWQKAILVLREIKKYQKNNKNWQPRYPNIYFDPAFSFKENNSFEYAFRFFRIEEKAVESLQKRNIKARKELRKPKTDVQKAQIQIRKMLRGELSLDRVLEYVKYNCNAQVNDNLKQLIKRESSKINA
ncbi:MAG: hypothetical protein WCD31_12395 [Gillisia sp.]